MTGPGISPSKGTKVATVHPQGPVATPPDKGPPSKNRAPSANRTVHKEAVMDHKVFIVGDSELASRVAALLDATLIAAVTGDALLENFREIMANVEGPVKVAFIDCTPHSRWCPL